MTCREMEGTKLLQSILTSRIWNRQGRERHQWKGNKKFMNHILELELERNTETSMNLTRVGNFSVPPPFRLVAFHPLMPKGIRKPGFRRQLSDQTFKDKVLWALGHAVTEENWKNYPLVQVRLWWVHKPNSKAVKAKIKESPHLRRRRSLQSCESRIISALEKPTNHMPVTHAILASQ